MDREKGLKLWNEYLENGGLIWLEESLSYPHSTEVVTTDDDGVIQDMYSAATANGYEGSLEEFWKEKEKEVADYLRVEIPLD